MGRRLTGATNCQIVTGIYSSNMRRTFHLIIKKASYVLLASLMIASLFGCGGGGSADTNGGQTATSEVALTLAWDAPTTNTDGSSLNPVTDISLYKIYYGTTSLTYTQVVNITNPGTTTISQTLNLSPGTYYFAVTTVDASGQESDYSNEVMKTI